VKNAFAVAFKRVRTSASRATLPSAQSKRIFLPRLKAREDVYPTHQEEVVYEVVGTISESKRDGTTSGAGVEVLTAMAISLVLFCRSR